MEFSALELQRRESLEKLRGLGIEPYPAALFPVTHKAKQIKDNFKEGERSGDRWTIDVATKLWGRASFAELLDSTDRIQVYFNRDEICPGEDKTLYNEVFKKLLNTRRFHRCERKIVHHASWGDFCSRD